MIYQIYNAKHRSDEAHQKWSKIYLLNPVAMDQLKVTLLIVLIHFVVLTLPTFIYAIYHYIVHRYLLLTYTLQLDAQQMLANAVCAMLEHLFLSGKFVIYFSSSLQFRKECYKLICKCRYKRQGYIKIMKKECTNVRVI